MHTVMLLISPIHRVRLLKRISTMLLALRRIFLIVIPMRLGTVVSITILKLVLFISVRDTTTPQRVGLLRGIALRVDVMIHLV